MNLSNDPAKMEIVSRLVKEGAIDFNEAIKLLEEPELHFDIPFKYPNGGLPPWPIDPIIPQWPQPWDTHNPWIVTYKGDLNGTCKTS